MKEPLGVQGKNPPRFSRGSVNYQLYTGVTHEFFGTSAIVAKAGQAQDLAASQLRAAFQ